MSIRASVEKISSNGKGNLEAVLVIKGLACAADQHDMTLANAVRAKVWGRVLTFNYPDHGDGNISTREIEVVDFKECARHDGTVLILGFDLHRQAYRSFDIVKMGYAEVAPFDIPARTIAPEEQ
jgi:predicted DNA-binding transcriptional regulator YafY